MFTKLISRNRKKVLLLAILRLQEDVKHYDLSRSKCIICSTSFCCGIIIVRGGSMFVDFVGYLYLWTNVSTSILQSNKSSNSVISQTNYAHEMTSQRTSKYLIFHEDWPPRRVTTGDSTRNLLIAKRMLYRLTASQMKGSSSIGQ